MRTLKISGGFHCMNGITIRMKDDRISIGQLERIEKHLCGIDDCKCGGFSSHEVRVNGLNRDEYFEECSDGGLQLEHRYVEAI